MSLFLEGCVLVCTLLASIVGGAAARLESPSLVSVLVSHSVHIFITPILSVDCCPPRAAHHTRARLIS